MPIKLHYTSEKKNTEKLDSSLKESEGSWRRMFHVRPVDRDAEAKKARENQTSAVEHKPKQSLMTIQIHFNLFWLISSIISTSVNLLFQKRIKITKRLLPESYQMGSFRKYNF